MKFAQKPKLRTYVLFKTSFQTENYVKWHMNKRNCSLLGQFRLDILSHNIEIGRYNNFPVEERLCCLCNQSDVESEQLF